MRKIVFCLACILLATCFFAGCDGKCEHVVTVDAAVAPTCTAVGKTEGSHCSVCNTVLTAQQEIPMIAHVPIPVSAVTPTCAAPGQSEGSRCAMCNLDIVAPVPLAQLAHTPVVTPDKAPTCTEPGTSGGTHCAVCEAVLTAPTKTADPCHTYVESIKTAATCTDAGVKVFTCSACQNTYEGAYSLERHSAEDLYDIVTASLVQITLFNRQGDELGRGSGFIVREDGVIVTNYHVIESAYSATVTVGNRTLNVQSVLAYDKEADLAVLQIKGSGLPCLPICTKPVRTGMIVYAAGNSLGILENTFTNGIITQAEREMDGIMYIQHNAAIAPGNSGGPLVNEFGEVIGINASSYLNSQNLNFAIFASELYTMKNQTPMDMDELYEKEFDAFKILRDVLIAAGATDGTIAKIGSSYVGGQEYIRYAGYDEDNGMISLVLETGRHYFELYFDRVGGVYYWYYEWDGDAMNGKINAATYEPNTYLTVDEYTSNQWYSTMRQYASTFINNLLSNLSADLDFLDISASDLGFLKF